MTETQQFLMELLGGAIADSTLIKARNIVMDNYGVMRKGTPQETAISMDSVGLTNEVVKNIEEGIRAGAEAMLAVVINAGLVTLPGEIQNDGRNSRDPSAS